MKLNRILIPVIIIAFLVGTAIVFFNKSTTDHFKGWRSINIGKEKETSETSVLLFNLYEFEYDGAYVKRGILYFFSSSSGNIVSFPEEQAVFNFSFSASDSTMFYLVVFEDSLYLKNALFFDNTVRMTDISPLNLHKTDLINPVSGHRAGIKVLHDTILIQAGYSGESRQFESTLAFIPGHEFKILSVDDFVNRRAIELIELQQNEEKKFMENIMLVKMKGFSDLHLMINQEPVALTSYHIESDNLPLNDSIFYPEMNDLRIIEDSIDYISSW